MDADPFNQQPMDADDSPPPKVQRTLMRRVSDAEATTQLKREAHLIRELGFDACKVSTATLNNCLATTASNDYSPPTAHMLQTNSQQMQRRAQQFEGEDKLAIPLTSRQQLEDYFLAIRPDRQPYLTWGKPLGSREAIHLFCDVVDALQDMSSKPVYMIGPASDVASFPQVLCFGNDTPLISGGFNGGYGDVNAFDLPSGLDSGAAKKMADKRANLINSQQSKCIFPVSSKICKTLCEKVPSWKVVQDLVIAALEEQVGVGMYDLIRADVLFMQNKTSHFTYACRASTLSLTLGIAIISHLMLYTTSRYHQDEATDMTVTVQLSLGRSTMHVAGAKHEAEYPIAGSAHLICGKMYHRSGLCTGRTVKISYFFKRQTGEFKMDPWYIMPADCPVDGPSPTPPPVPPAESGATLGVTKTVEDGGEGGLNTEQAGIGSATPFPEESATTTQPDEGGGEGGVDTETEQAGIGSATPFPEESAATPPDEGGGEGGVDTETEQAGIEHEDVEVSTTFLYSSRLVSVFITHLYRPRTVHFRHEHRSCSGGSHGRCRYSYHRSTYVCVIRRLFRLRVDGVDGCENLIQLLIAS